jgi:hypothetical protein
LKTNKYDWLIVLCVCALIAYAFVDRLLARYGDVVKQRDTAMAALERYQISNGKNIGRTRLQNFPYLYENIEHDTGTPRKIILAVGIHENLGDVFSHGVKKVPDTFPKYYPVEEWQGRACARIATQEAFAFIMSDEGMRKAYFDRLGKRYCPNNAVRWSTDVRRLYFEMEGVVENGRTRKADK